MRGRETSFLVDIKNSFEAMEYFFYKIPDSPTSYGRGTKMRFTLPKPFDAIGVAAGFPLAVEAKVSKGYKAFGMKDMRPSQITNLDKFIMAGGKSFVFLKVWSPKTEKTKRFNRLLIFDWQYCRDEWLKGTMKQKELMDWPYIDYRKKLYDLSDWYGYKR